MKKIWQKILFFTVLLGALLCVPVLAADKWETSHEYLEFSAVERLQSSYDLLYYPGKKLPINYLLNNSKELFGLGAYGESTTPTVQVTSSNTSVIKIRHAKNEANSSARETYTAVAKGAGTATVTIKYSVKYAGETHKITKKVKFKVQKYENPIAYFKVGSTTLKSSKFNKRHWIDLKYSKFKNKTVKVRCKLKSGWEFKWKYTYFDKKSNNYTTTDKSAVYYYEKWQGQPSEIANGGKVKIQGGSGFFLRVTAVSKKTGQEEEIFIRFK